MAEKINPQEIADVEKRAIEDTEREIKLAFNVLKEFRDSQKTTADENVGWAINDLLVNLSILDLKQERWKDYGLDVTEEELNSLIDEYNATKHRK